MEKEEKKEEKKGFPIKIAAIHGSNHLSFFSICPLGAAATPAPAGPPGGMFKDRPQ